MEYISFHGYIRNTASDTEVHAEPSLELTGVPDQWKRIYKKTHAKLGRKTTCGIFVPDQGSSPEPLEWEH